MTSSSSSSPASSSSSTPACIACHSKRPVPATILKLSPSCVCHPEQVLYIHSKCIPFVVCRVPNPSPTPSLPPDTVPLLFIHHSYQTSACRLRLLSDARA